MPQGAVTSTGVMINGKQHTCLACTGTNVLTTEVWQFQIPFPIYTITLIEVSWVDGLITAGEFVTPTAGLTLNYNPDVPSMNRVWVCTEPDTTVRQEGALYVSTGQPNNTILFVRPTPSGLAPNIAMRITLHGGQD